MKKQQSIACCGVDCAQCGAFPTECGGCRGTEGRVPWTAFLNLEQCAIYSCCVEDKKHCHCGVCPQFPCRQFRDMKNPSFSEEEFAADMQSRRHNLEFLLRLDTEKPNS